ncbi:hypothetical protein PG987_004794 [Apiospora arundinis]
MTRSWRKPEIQSSRKRELDYEESLPCNVRHIAPGWSYPQDTPAILLGTYSPEHRVVPWGVVKFVISQVLGDSKDNEEHDACAVSFLKQYASPWTFHTWTNWCYLTNTTFHAQFHVCYLTASPCQASRSEQPVYAGIGIERRKLATTGIGNLPDHVAEARLSIAITASLVSESPVYTILALADDDSFHGHRIADQSLWDTIGLDASPTFGGVFILQAAVGAVLCEWYARWSELLRFVVLQPETGQLQVSLWHKEKHLLIESEFMIGRTSEDLRNHIDDLRQSLSAHVGQDGAALDANWDALTSHFDKRKQFLFDHIQYRLGMLDLLQQQHVLAVCSIAWNMAKRRPRATLWSSVTSLACFLFGFWGALLLFMTGFVYGIQQRQKRTE